MTLLQTRRQPRIRRASAANLAEAAPSTPAVRRVGLGYLLQQTCSAGPLVLSDVVCLFVGIAVGTQICQWLGFAFSVPLNVVATYMAVGLVGCCGLMRLYPAIGMHPVEELRQTVTAVTAANAVFLVAFLARNLGGTAKWVVLFGTIWSLTSVLMPLARSWVRGLLCRAHWWSQPVLIVGSKRQASHVASQLAAEPKQGVRPAGFIDCDPSCSQPAAGNVVGALADLPAVAKKMRVYRSIVAMQDIAPHRRPHVVDGCSLAFPHVVVMTDDNELPSLLTATRCLGGSTGLIVKERLLLPLPRIVKRGMDVALVLLAGLLFLPLLLGIMIAVRITSKGPVFYCQRRRGTAGSTFWAWKFRSMVCNADEVLAEYLDANPAARREWEADHKLKRDPRITWVGRFLRKTSLDELPQLWNVLRGEMSVVGPRPIVDAEIPKYENTYQYYSRVKPGITGLWQISGRNNTTYERRVGLDLYYTKNWSPWLDVYILARTLRVVLMCEGAY